MKRYLVRIKKERIQREKKRLAEKYLLSLNLPVPSLEQIRASLVKLGLDPRTGRPVEKPGVSDER